MESREIQDEGEEFFNSLDPESWEDKNETPFLFRLTKQLRKWNRENFEESTDSIGGEDASSKRLKGVAARWNPRGFGFIIPEDGGDDIFCILSSITDGNALREGDIVEYEAEYDERKGKYRAIEVTGGRKEGGADKQIAIQFNKKILSSDTETLCGIIKTRAADFNHINVATSLRKALEAPRHLVPKEILDIVGESLLKNMLSFEPQGVANRLYIMAKKKYTPQERLFSAIEQRAEVISGEFKTQEIANTLWAYATMGRKPGERLMGLLEGRAEAIRSDWPCEVNSPDIASACTSSSPINRSPGFLPIVAYAHSVFATACELNSPGFASSRRSSASTKVSLGL